jgi:hypothetical protein
MATKPKRAEGRSLSDFKNRSPAENRLIECCRTDEPFSVGNGTLPKKASAANKIRPALVRFLALGGDGAAPVHETGFYLEGAWLDNDLVLDECSCRSNIVLNNCVIKGTIYLRNSQLKSLSLAGSHIGALNADGSHLIGDIFLTNEFKATGTVSLLGAQIGGTLDCVNGQFEPEEGEALITDLAMIRGNVSLDGNFKATGEVRFHSAQIGGNLDCSDGLFQPKEGNALNADRAVIKGDVFLNGKFKSMGTVRLLGAQIDGDLSCRNGQFESIQGYAFSADGAVITGVVFLDGDFKALGPVHFADAKVGSIIDEPNDLPKGSILDGLTYGSFSGGTQTDAATRIAWLEKQPHDHLYKDFRPQPWEQLIKVLRTMGHTQDADEVAIAKQNQLYRAGKITGFNKIWHKLYGLFAGYGYRPTRTIMAMVFVWFFAGLYFQFAGEFGLVGPTSAVIQSNADMDKICNVADKFRETQWTNCKALPQTYTTFSPYLYSLDLILPLVDLQQDKDWSPIVMKPDAKTIIWSGVGIRAAMWFEILFGWMASLLLAAVLGNLVKKD